MKIAFCAPGDDPARWQAALRQHLAGVELLPWTERMQRIEARYALIWSPPVDFFVALQGAKALFNLGAGVDALLRTPDLAERTRGTPIIRIEDAGMGAMMAEYVVHAIARHTRHFRRFELQQDEARWIKHRPQARSAWPVGVMGLGEMGGRIARVLAALDYPVSAWSRTPRVIEGVRCHAGEKGLAAFLSVSRILVNALPLTPHTQGVLDAKAFAQLPP
ncbi:MAG TPA: NAD(P)-dependent oxidoreductase, partial [Usitatibacteraceae bacterium]|nr:NAD(P)-dependent oxidoreductase [Usitatibacteraceae bacterium]